MCVSIRYIQNGNGTRNYSQLDLHHPLPGEMGSPCDDEHLSTALCLRLLSLEWAWSVCASAKHRQRVSGPCDGSWEGEGCAPHIYPPQKNFSFS